MRFGLDSLQLPLNRPATLLAVGLASVAFSGCGGGDKTLEFRAACPAGGTPEVLGAKESPGGGLTYVDIGCKDLSGNTTAPLYLQENRINDASAIRPNFRITFLVNQEGHWYFPMHEQVDAFYEAIPRSPDAVSASIGLDGIDELKDVHISRITS